MDNTNIEKQLDHVGYQLTGADGHVKSREARIGQTPINNVVWSGGRGSSDCYPTDKESIAFLKKYNQECVSYDRSGEPNFAPFETANVRISDMGNNRQKNFSSAGKKLLESDWAKEKGITNLTELEAYRKKHNLTWHECSDGITMRLVPTKINARYGHAGGVSELGENVANIKDDGVLRTVGSIQGKATINVNKTSVKVEEGFAEVGKTFTGIARDFNVPNVGELGVQAISDAGTDFVSGAQKAIDNSSFVLLNVGVQNLCEVAAGQKTIEEASCEMASITANIVVTSGTSNAIGNVILKTADTFGIESLKVISEKAGGPAQMVVIATAISGSFIKLLNYEIDGNEFFGEIIKNKDLLMSVAASLFPGNIVGAAIAAYMSVVTISSVCSQTFMTISNLCKTYIAKREAYAKELAEINRVMDRAILEMQYQQEELKQLIEERNNSWTEEFESGFQVILDSMLTGNLEELSGGLNQILHVFGKDVLFENMEEFDEFFFDDEAVLAL